VMWGCSIHMAKQKGTLDPCTQSLLLIGAAHCLFLSPLGVWRFPFNRLK